MVIAKELDNPDDPCWEPLRLVLGPLTVPDFMFMGKAGTVLAPSPIYLYKNRFSRRYLCLDENGGAYFIESERSGRKSYVPVLQISALRRVFS